jgi:hypothetical protein
LFKVVGFTTLPQWLQDNDFLRKGHRPPLPSFRYVPDRLRFFAILSDSVFALTW